MLLYPKEKQVFDVIRYAKNKEKLKELVKIKEGTEGEEIDVCQALKEWAEEERVQYLAKICN